MEKYVVAIVYETDNMVVRQTIKIDMVEANSGHEALGKAINNTWSDGSKIVSYQYDPVSKWVL